MASRLRRRKARRELEAQEQAPEEGLDVLDQIDIDLDPDDPIMAYFQSATEAVDIATLESLDIESPAIEELKAKDVRIVLPFVSQGELIGLLFLGPRLSEQEYSADDRKLLDHLAAHAAPAINLSIKVKQQEAYARTRERYEQDLRVGQMIQKNMLPESPPTPAGWQLSAYYRAARQVGGDFYDFIGLPEGRLGLVIGDVTDKGMPAALVMASTMSTLRAAAKSLVSPGAVLEKTNEEVVPTIPPKMFVTCMYGVLDPTTGIFKYANAGHNVPYLRTAGGVEEMRATGMPLGLMPGMDYEEKEITINPGETFLLHSDGLVEAHSPDGEMFGFPRMMGMVGKHPGGPELIDHLLEELDSFVSESWEQEDDVTLVSIQRLGSAEFSGATEESSALVEIAKFSVPSEPGNERDVMVRVADLVKDFDIPGPRLEKLKTAVAEATMNAIEHGNENDPALPVDVTVFRSDSELRVTISDLGGSKEVPEAEEPDIEAKLAGEQKPRGWGLFLIKNMVDEMNVTSDETHHTIELVLHLKGDPDGS